MAHVISTSAGRVHQMFPVSPWVQLSMGGLNVASYLMPKLMTDIAYFLWTRPRRRPLKYLEVLPTGSTQTACSHKGGYVRGFRWGSPSRPKALLIHGWESNLGRMLPMVMPLLNLGYQVIAIDAPAHGLSDHRTTDVYDFGAAVASMIEKERGVDLIVAHSYGAAATLFMLEQEQRLSPKNMVCLAPMVDMGIHISIYQAVSGLSDRMMSRIRQEIEQKLPVPINCLNWHLLSIGPMLHFSGLIIHDLEDQIVPIGLGHSLAASWSGAELIVTEGLGHNRILREAEVISHLVAWVEKRSSA